MSKGKGIALAILPALLMFIIQNGIALMGMQLYTVVLLWQKEYTSVFQLLDDVILYITSIEGSMFLSILAGTISVVIFLVWYIRLLKKESLVREHTRQEIVVGEKSFKLLVIPGIILVVIGCEYAGAFLVEILARVFPGWLMQYQDIMQNVGIDVTGQAAIPMIMVFYVTLIAPLTEELVFRGLCIKYAYGRISLWPSVVLSSVLFALMHANLLQGVYTFAFGLVLGYIFAKTDRLWIVFIIHAAYNFTSAVLAKYLVMGESPILNFIILFASLLAIYAGCRLLVRAYPQK